MLRYNYAKNEKDVNLSKDKYLFTIDKFKYDHMYKMDQLREISLNL